VQELLQLVFSKKELGAYNLSKLIIEKDSFVEKRADLIVSVPFREDSKIKLRILILLEHKSFYDKDLFTRVLKYQILIREYIIQQTGCPWPVIPVLFYHGKEPLKWKQSLQEEDFKAFFPKIPIDSRKDMLHFGLRIIDTKDLKIQRACEDKKFKSQGVIKLLSEIWNIKKINLPIVQDVFAGFENILKPLKGEREREVSLRILEYLFDNTDLSQEIWERAEVFLIEEGILTAGGIMDVREYIKEKGRWEGRQEGRQERDKEVVLNMLKEKINVSVISKVTGLPEKEIKKLKNGS